MLLRMGHYIGLMIKRYAFFYFENDKFRRFSLPSPDQGHVEEIGDISEQLGVISVLL